MPASSGPRPPCSWGCAGWAGAAAGSEGRHRHSLSRPSLLSPGRGPHPHPAPQEMGCYPERWSIWRKGKMTQRTAGAAAPPGLAEAQCTPRWAPKRPQLRDLTLPQPQLYTAPQPHLRLPRARSGLRSQAQRPRLARESPSARPSGGTPGRWHPGKPQASCLAHPHVADTFLPLAAVGGRGVLASSLE